jgi:hypothetical protein
MPLDGQDGNCGLQILVGDPKLRLKLFGLTFYFGRISLSKLLSLQEVVNCD